ncbi:MAG TPA: hypothetical protein VER96_20950 [Polyangiaceae bacterium]|nr:hypothetical protein [Polyangiaceae bacterium]
MARWRFLLGDLSALLALACTPPATAPSVIPTSPRASTSVAGRPPLVRGAWREVRYPQTPNHVLLMSNEPDGTQLIAVDGFRMKQRGERVEFAKQVLEPAILRSCSAGHGWVHVTEERDVYRSDSFLGNLELVGHVDNFDFLQCGPQAVTLRPRPVFWSDGETQRLTWDSPIGWASFSDAKRGDALAFPDFWLKTSDGGKTFARAPAPFSMVDAFARVPPVQFGLLSEADFRLALRAWSRRALRSVAGRAVADFELSDGTAVRITATQEVLNIELRTAQGKFSSVEVSGNCNDAEAWGSKLALLCFTDPAAQQSILRVLYPNQETLPGPPLPPQSGLVADPTGRYLFAQGRMIDHPRQKTRPLMRFDGKAWQVFEHIDSPPIAVRHGWLLLDAPPRAVPVEHPDQDPIFLPGANLDPNHQEAAVLEHSIVYLRHESDGTKNEWVELELPSGHELRVTPSSTASSARLPPELRCGTAPSCSITPTTAWTSLLDEDEPELLPTPPRHDYLSDAVNGDPGFSIRNYVCELAANLGQKDQELLGIQPIPGSQSQRIVAIPSMGGMLDMSDADSGSILSWHGVDAAGTFTARTPETQAIAELKSGMPRSTEDAWQVWPVLVTRNFLLLNENVEPELSHRVRLLNKDGSVSELVPNGDFQPLVVPLGDGRSLLSVERDAYQELMLLTSDGRVAQRRFFLVNADLRTFLALRAGVPGLVSSDGRQPAFFSLEPETPGIPVELATNRDLEPCRKKPNPSALRLFVEGETALDRALSVAGFFTLGEANDRPRKLAVVDSTPSASCLRGMLLDAPTSTELFSNGPRLTGRVQGQTKTHALVCRSLKRSP